VHKKLVIASDFLYQKDVRFFSEFAKKEKVKIEIVHLRADSILFRLKKDAYNTDIDLVLVQSLLSIKSLGNHAFQKIDQTTQQQLTRLPQFEKNWYLIGRDPFVLTYLKDSLEKPHAYRELSTDFLWASPDVPSLEVLKAQVRYQYEHQKKKKENQRSLKEWLRGLKDHRVNYQEGSDSTASTQLLLMRNSSYLSNKPLLRTKKRVVIFPKNAYFDYFATAIVSQAKDYEVSKSFLLFWNEHAIDKRFLKQFGITPLAKVKKGRAFYISPKEILTSLSKRK
jgi:ABC-type Fe3+ transport system substrate-binding protein